MRVLWRTPEVLMTVYNQYPSPNFRPAIAQLKLLAVWQTWSEDGHKVDGFSEDLMDLAKLWLQAACCAACASTRYRLQRFLLLLGVIEGRRRFYPRNVEERSDCTETFLQRDEDIGDIWFLKRDEKKRKRKYWTAPRYFHFREVEMEMLNLMLRQLPSATHSKESNKQCFFCLQKVKQLAWVEWEKKYYLCNTPSGVIMSTRHCLGQKWRFMINKDFNGHCEYNPRWTLLTRDLFSFFGSIVDKRWLNALKLHPDRQCW